jgi:hypothetical protein
MNHSHTLKHQEDLKRTYKNQAPPDQGLITLAKLLFAVSLCLCLNTVKHGATFVGPNGYKNWYFKTFDESRIIPIKNKFSAIKFRKNKKTGRRLTGSQLRQLKFESRPLFDDYKDRTPAIPCQPIFTWLDDEEWTVVNLDTTEELIEVCDQNGSPFKETESKQILVGGDGDCWSELPKTMEQCVPPPNRNQMSAADLATRLRICCSNETASWQRVDPTTYSILYEWQLDGDLHISAVHKKSDWFFSASNNCACGALYPKPKVCKCVDITQFLSVLDEASSRSTIKNVMKRADSGYWSPEMEELPLKEIGGKTFIVNKTSVPVIEERPVMVGALEDSLLKNDFFESLEDMIGDDIGQKYREAIGDHDNRVINNTFSRFNYNTLYTSRPSRKLAGSDYKDMNRFLINTTRTTFMDNDKQFLFDLMSTYAYNNCIPDNTSCDEVIRELLCHQKFFQDPNGVDMRYRISIDPQVEDVDDHEFVFMLGPCVPESGEGPLERELGWYKHVNGVLYYTIGADTKAECVSTFSKLLYSDSMLSGNNVITVVARKVFGPMQVICMTKMKGDYIVSGEDESMTFEIPVLNDSLFKLGSIDLIRLERRRLHKKLITRLMNLNITGKVSQEKMIEYAMALSWYSYNKRGVEVMQHTITAEDAYTHVYVARMLLTRQNWYDNILGMVNTNGLSKLCASALSAMFTFSVENITEKDNSLDILKQLFDLLKNPAIRSSVGTGLERWASIDCWTKQVSYTIIHTNEWHACNHHSVCPEADTGRICSCCSAPTAGLNNLCKCCYLEFTSCVHDCDPNNHQGQYAVNICACCKKKTSNEKFCDCCLVEIKIIDYTTEQTTASKPDNRFSGRTDFKHEKSKFDRQTGNKPTAVEFRKPIATQTLREEYAMKYAKQEVVSCLQPVAIAVLYDHKPISYQLPHDFRTSLVPFLCAKHPVFDRDLLNIEVVYDPKVGDCGMACIRYFTEMSYSESFVRDLLKGRMSNLSAINISLVLNSYGINCMIIDNTGVYTYRADDTDLWACIEMTDGLDQHWVCSSVTWKMTTSINKYCHNPSTPDEHERLSSKLFGMSYSNTNDAMKVTIAFTLHEKYTWKIPQKLSIPSFRNGVFSNSLDHNVSKGLFNINVGMEWATLLDKFCTAIKNQLAPEEFNVVFDVDIENVANVELNSKHILLDCMWKICKLFLEPGAYCERRKVKPLLIKGVPYIDLAAHKVKNGDVVFINSGGSWNASFVVMQEGKCQIETVQKNRELEVMIPKASYMSTIITMLSILSNEIDSDKLNNLYINSTVICGVAGSGKSVTVGKIVRDTKEKCTVVACTRGGVNSLLPKVPANTSVLSVERCSYEKCKTKILIIDEATLLHPWKIANLLTTKVEKLYLLGDPLQIPAVDFFSSGGSRINTNSLRHAMKLTKDVTNLSVTYRFGNPLTSEISKHSAMSDLESKSDHDTVFETFYLPNWHLDEIASAIGKTTVILTFYNDHATRIKKYFEMRQQHRIVQTVHTYQGQENPNVAIIQAPLIGTGADIHLNTQYCLSAATRATTKLTWISVDCFSGVTPLHKRFGGVVAGNEEILTFDGEILPKRELEVYSGSKNLEDSFDFTEFCSEITNEVPMISLKLIKLKDDDLLIEARMLMLTASLSYNVRNGLKCSDNILQYQNKLSDLISKCRSDNPRKTDIVYSISKKNQYRCRVLAWITKVLNASNRDNIVKHDGHKFRISLENNECAACCALVISVDGVENHISKDYLSSNSRVISGPNADIIYELFECEHFSLMEERFDSKVLSHVILTERFRTAVKDLPHNWTGFEKVMWYTQSPNVLLSRELIQEMGLKINVTGYDCMNWYPFVKKNVLGRSKVSYIRNGERKFDVKRGKFMDYIYESLHSMHEHQKQHYSTRLVAKVYTNLVGAPHVLKLPGMSETIEWHRQHKTKAYYNLVERVGALRISSLAEADSLKYLPDNVFTSIRDNSDMKQFASNNKNALGDARHAACDILTASMFEHCKMEIQYYMNTSYASYCSNQNHKVSYDLCSSNGVIDYKLQKALFVDMLQQHMARLPADGVMYSKIKRQLEFEDVWTGTNNNAEMAVCGPNILQMSATEWGRMLDDFREVFFWCPIQHHNIDGSWFFKFNDSRTLYPVSKKLLDAIVQGKPFSTPQGNFVIHTMKYEAGFRLCHIVAASGSSWMDVAIQNDKYVVIDIPEIILDPIHAISSKTLLKTRQLNINVHVLGNLRRRLLRPDTTYEDLLVQVRTLQNSVSYSTSSVNSRFNLTESEILDTARIAWLMHQHMLYKYKLIAKEYGLYQHLFLSLESLIGKIVNKFIPKMNYKNLYEYFVNVTGIDSFKPFMQLLVTNLDALSTMTCDEVRDLKIGGVAVQSRNAVLTAIEGLSYVKETFLGSTLQYFVCAACDLCKKIGLDRLELLSSDSLVTAGMTPKTDSSVQLCTRKCNHLGGYRKRFVDHQEKDLKIASTIDDYYKDDYLWLGLNTYRADKGEYCYPRDNYIKIDGKSVIYPEGTHVVMVDMVDEYIKTLCAFSRDKIFFVESNKYHQMVVSSTSNNRVYFYDKRTGRHREVTTKVRFNLSERNDNVLRGKKVSDTKQSKILSDLASSVSAPTSGLSYTSYGTDSSGSQDVGEALLPWQSPVPWVLPLCAAEHEAKTNGLITTYSGRSEDKTPHLYYIPDLVETREFRNILEDSELLIKYAVLLNERDSDKVEADGDLQSVKPTGEYYHDKHLYRCTNNHTFGIDSYHWKLLCHCGERVSLIASPRSNGIDFTKSFDLFNSNGNRLVHSRPPTPAVSDEEPNLQENLSYSFEPSKDDKSNYFYNLIRHKVDSIDTSILGPELTNALSSLGFLPPDSTMLECHAAGAHDRSCGRGDYCFSANKWQLENTFVGDITREMFLFLCWFKEEIAMCVESIEEENDGNCEGYIAITGMTGEYYRSPPRGCIGMISITFDPENSIPTDLPKTRHIKLNSSLGRYGASLRVIAGCLIGRPFQICNGRAKYMHTCIELILSEVNYKSNVMCVTNKSEPWIIDGLRVHHPPSISNLATLISLNLWHGDIYGCDETYLHLWEINRLLTQKNNVDLKGESISVDLLKAIFNNDSLKLDFLDDLSLPPYVDLETCSKDYEVSQTSQFLKLVDPYRSIGDSRKNVVKLSPLEQNLIDMQFFTMSSYFALSENSKAPSNQISEEAIQEFVSNISEASGDISRSEKLEGKLESLVSSWPDEVSDTFLKISGHMELYQKIGRLEPKKELYVNPAMALKDARIAVCKNLTSSRVHCVDENYAKGCILEDDEINFLRKLCYKVESLNSNKNTIWYVASLDPGVAMRSAPTDPREGVRYIAFCSKGNAAAIEEAGFEPLEFDGTIGRLGANLRYMLALLLPSYKEVHIISGRPGLHALAAEHRISNIGDIKVNTVVTPSKGCAVFLDGMVIVKKPSEMDMCKYINSNLAYASVYGIDECNWELFGIKQCYVIHSCHIRYSNAMLTNFDDNMTKTCSIRSWYSRNYVATKWFEEADVVDSFARDYVKYLSLVKEIDPRTLGNDTRGRKTAITCARANELINIFKSQLTDHGLPDFTRFNLTNSRIRSGNTYVKENIQCDDGKMLINSWYDPQEKDYCATRVLHHCLTRSGTQVPFDTLRNIIGSLPNEPFEKLLEWFPLCDLNVLVVNGRTGQLILVDESKEIYIIEVVQGLNVGHVRCNEKTMMREELNSIKAGQIKDSIDVDEVRIKNSILDINLAVAISKCQMNEHECFQTGYSKVLHTRIHGRADIIVLRNGGWNLTRKITGKIFDSVPELIPGKVYLVLHNGQFEARLCMESDLGPVIATSNGPKLVGNINVTAYKYDKVFKRVVGPEAPNFGALNTNTKNRLKRERHEYANISVTTNCGKILVTDTDNRNHHNLPEHDILSSKDCYIPLDDGLKLVDKKTMQYDAGINVGLSNGRMVPMMNVRQDFADMFKDSFEQGLRSGNSNYDNWFFSTGLAKWIKEGNTFIPNTKKIVDLFKGKTLTGVDAYDLLVKEYGSMVPMPGVQDYFKEIRFDVENYEMGVDANVYDSYEQNERILFMTTTMEIVRFSPVGEGRSKLDTHITIDDLPVGEHDKVFGKTNVTKIEVASNNKLDDREFLNTVYSLDMLNGERYEDVSDVVIPTNDGKQDVLLVGNGVMTSALNGEVVPEMILPNVMDYWNDETGMLPTSISLPHKDINLSSNPEFTGIKNILKAKMVEYPSHSQPAYTKRMHAGLQAVSELFGSNLVLREVEHDPIQDAKTFAETYFKKGMMQELDEVTINPEDVLAWIKERPDGAKIADDLMEVMTHGMDVNGLDKVNVHMKMESRMKDALMYDYTNKMPDTIEEQRIRLIVWQRKGITSIFSPFFKKLKENLKKLLIERVIYADGLTPAQLSAYYNKIRKSDSEIVFAEDDLKKQDRQTDMTLINTEMEIYKLLGGKPSVVNMWHQVHRHWRAKGIGLKFVGEASRHTGQATTALGNVIVNLNVKARLVKELGNRLLLMTVLGDDNLIIARRPITKEMIELNSARHFNMQSEASIDEVCGTFLRNIIYENSNGNLESGPDIIRLRRRFEVLNGVSENTLENMKMRAMSYCCMLGSSPETESVNDEMSFGLKLDEWYEYASLREALSHKYKCSAAHVDYHLNALTSMMKMQDIILDEKLMFTEAGH